MGSVRISAIGLREIVNKIDQSCGFFTTYGVKPGGV
jgi:hypothetical protein